MGILFTTSKGPGAGARNLCRCLAEMIPGAICENRGEKSVEDVVGRARLFGKGRICLIHGKAGKPSEMHFARVRANSWGWLEPVFTIKSAKLCKPICQEPESITLKGAAAEEWRSLLAVGEEEGGEATAACAKGSFKLMLGKKTVLELVFG